MQRVLWKQRKGARTKWGSKEVGVPKWVSPAKGDTWVEVKLSRWEITAEDGERGREGRRGGEGEGDRGIPRKQVSWRSAFGKMRP